HRLRDPRNPAPRQELDDEGYGGGARRQLLRAASAVGQEATPRNDRGASDGDAQFQHVSSRESHCSPSRSVSLGNGQDTGPRGFAARLLCSLTWHFSLPKPDSQEVPSEAS